MQTEIFFISKSGVFSILIHFFEGMFFIMRLKLRRLENTRTKLFYAFLTNSILREKATRREKKNFQRSNIMLHKKCIITMRSLILIWIHKAQTSFLYPDSFIFLLAGFGILSNNLFPCQKRGFSRKKFLNKTFIINFYMHDFAQVLTLMYES